MIDDGSAIRKHITLNIEVPLWTDPARSVGRLRAGGRFNWSAIVQRHSTVWIRVASGRQVHWVRWIYRRHLTASILKVEVN